MYYIDKPREKLPSFVAGRLVTCSLTSREMEKEKRFPSTSLRRPKVCIFMSPALGYDITLLQSVHSPILVITYLAPKRVFSGIKLCSKMPIQSVHSEQNVVKLKGSFFNRSTSCHQSSRSASKLFPNVTGCCRSMSPNVSRATGFLYFFDPDCTCI